MKPMSAWRYFVLARFSKPTNDRIAYQAIKKGGFTSIVEVGLTDGTRCENMIRVAQKFSPDAKIRYTGIDLFDARETQQPLKLLDTHKRLNSLGAKVKLVPGEFNDGVQRIANSHTRTDLVVIECADESEKLEAVWRFVPRMLHANSLVVVMYPGDEYEALNFLEVEKLASQVVDRSKIPAAA